MQNEAKAAAVAGAEFSKFSGWPELKEAFISGRIKAAFMLAPMVMDLADGGFPMNIVALGHPLGAVALVDRSGAVVMVRKEFPGKTFSDLKRKRVAVPSRFAVDYLFVRKLMKRYGVKDKEIELVEMNPPDMPAALYAKSVDAYATGEP